MSKLSQTYALHRTSPKGEGFVGTCSQCSQTGLTLANMGEPCLNQRGLTEGEALLEALEQSNNCHTQKGKDQ